MSELSFLAAGLDAARAPVLTHKFHLAQAAQKSAASIAWDHGALVGMVEATGFARFQHRRCPGWGLQPRKKSREYQSRKRSAAGCAKGVLAIPVRGRDWRVASGARELFRRELHAGYFLITRVSQIRSCKARFSSS